MENGEKFYELRGEPVEGEEEETDVFYIKKGFVTVTPLHYDLTNYRMIDEVSKWF
jgi:5'-nucleotidase